MSFVKVNVVADSELRNQFRHGATSVDADLDRLYDLQQKIGNIALEDLKLPDIVPFEEYKANLEAEVSSLRQSVKEKLGTDPEENLSAVNIFKGLLALDQDNVSINDTYLWKKQELKTLNREEYEYEQARTLEFAQQDISDAEEYRALLERESELQDTANLERHDAALKTMRFNPQSSAIAEKNSQLAVIFEGESYSVYGLDADELQAGFEQAEATKGETVDLTKKQKSLTAVLIAR